MPLNTLRNDFHSFKRAHFRFWGAEKPSIFSIILAYPPYQCYPQGLLKKKRKKKSFLRLKKIPIWGWGSLLTVMTTLLWVWSDCWQVPTVGRGLGNRHSVLPRGFIYNRPFSCVSQQHQWDLYLPLTGIVTSEFPWQVLWQILSTAYNFCVVFY